MPLTYYVAWHMRRALSSLMYAEDDLPATRAERRPPMELRLRQNRFLRRLQKKEG